METGRSNGLAHSVSGRRHCVGFADL
jgi:hypothetical protein